VKAFTYSVTLTTVHNTQHPESFPTPRTPVVRFVKTVRRSVRKTLLSPLLIETKHKLTNVVHSIHSYNCQNQEDPYSAVT